MWLAVSLGTHRLLFATCQAIVDLKPPNPFPGFAPEAGIQTTSRNALRAHADAVAPLTNHRNGSPTSYRDCLR